MWFSEKMEQPKEIVPFGLLFAFTIFSHFHLNSFNTWFVVGILRFQKWFDVDFLDF
jgi:hypothetical protein